MLEEEIKIVPLSGFDYRAYQNPSFEEAAKEKIVKNSRPLIEANSFGKKILESLCRISGIEQAFFSKINQIAIVKGRAFDWEDIDLQVVDVLIGLFQNPKDECSFENKKLAPKCLIRILKNDFYREYHFNTVIFPGKCWNHYNSLSDLDSPIREVIEEIEDLFDKMEIVCLEKHSIRIRREFLFDWNYVEKLLEPIFSKIFDGPVKIETIKEENFFD